MRPVNRGENPQNADFDAYRDAFPYLLARLGPYCSYCERRINTNLAVEHIQPKALAAYEHLEGSWDNFLLGCVNCNSTKGKKNVLLAGFLLPDRDNTFFAYHYRQDGVHYRQDGVIHINDQLTAEQQMLAKATLSLVGLDKAIVEVSDENGQLVATDRVAQRMETWLIAQDSKEELESSPTEGMRRQVVRTALGEGHFSVWMAVFKDDAKTLEALIDQFIGTAKECFASPAFAAVSPRPNNGITDGSKV